MDYDPEIVAADRRDQAPFDVNPALVSRVESIYQNLQQELQKKT
jgi:hypothetical protein